MRRDTCVVARAVADKNHEDIGTKILRHIEKWDRGGTVVKALCYKSEGRWLDPRWCHWNFSLTLSFRSHCGTRVDSASNRNEYQDDFLGVKAAGA